MFWMYMQMWKYKQNYLKTASDHHKIDETEILKITYHTENDILNQYLLNRKGKSLIRLLNKIVSVSNIRLY